MTCPGPKSPRRGGKSSTTTDTALPDAFTLRFRRQRTGGWVVSVKDVSASGPNAESAAKDALEALAASAEGGRHG